MNLFYFLPSLREKCESVVLFDHNFNFSKTSFWRSRSALWAHPRLTRTFLRRNPSWKLTCLEGIRVDIHADWRVSLHKFSNWTGCSIINNYLVKSTAKIINLDSFLFCFQHFCSNECNCQCLWRMKSIRQDFVGNYALISSTDPLMIDLFFVGIRLDKDRVNRGSR